MTAPQPALAIDFENDGQETVVDLATGNQLDEHGFPKEMLEDRPVVLASDDPEAANAITAVALQLEKTEDFSISGPPDGKAKLIAGLVTDDGQRITDAEVKELNGADEEAIAKALATKDMARYVDTIIRCGTSGVGEIEDPKDLQKALDKLLIGDRDVLLMEIRRITFGDTMRLEIICPWCEHDFAVDYSFSDDVPMRGINVEGAPDPMQRLYDLELPSGKVCEIRLVDGAAQKRIYTLDNLAKTDEELNTIMLAELLSTLDGKPVGGPGPVLKLGAKDRRFLVNFLADSQPGPQWADVKQECPSCAREFPLQVSVRDMFRGD